MHDTNKYESEILESHLIMMEVSDGCIEVITEDKFEKIAQDIDSIFASVKIYSK